MAYFLLCNRLATHEFLKLLYILIRVIGQAMAFPAITAGPTRFRQLPTSHVRRIGRR